jgi:hypothetical protein
MDKFANECIFLLTWATKEGGRHLIIIRKYTKNEVEIVQIL